MRSACIDQPVEPDRDRGSQRRWSPRRAGGGYGSEKHRLSAARVGCASREQSDFVFREQNERRLPLKVSAHRLRPRLVTLATLLIALAGCRRNREAVFKLLGPDET